MDQATKPHPNAEILKAIADGVAVQWRWAGLREDAQIWRDYAEDRRVNPLFVSDGVEWRIKPQPKANYVVMMRRESDGLVMPSCTQRDSLADVCRVLKHMSPGPFIAIGVTAFTYDTDITKIEYFTMKELREKGWL